MIDSKTRILVVDDMMAMRKIISNSLRECGFIDVTEAEDGAVAWQKAHTAEPPFGLIISDWNMPKETGFNLLSRLREDSRYRTAYFILVTAETEQGQIQDAMEAGADGYLVKPFNTELLKAKFKELKLIG